MYFLNLAMNTQSICYSPSFKIEREQDYFTFQVCWASFKISEHGKKFSYNRVCLAVQFQKNISACRCVCTHLSEAGVMTDQMQHLIWSPLMRKQLCLILSIAFVMRSHSSNTDQYQIDFSFKNRRTSLAYSLQKQLVFGNEILYKLLRKKRKKNS